MKLERKSYLVEASLKKYILASIITTAVTNLNGMIDGILMGNLLGPDALSAINLCLPVINGLVAVYQLLTNGAVMIAARAIGKMDHRRVNEVFTISSVSVVTAGILLAALSLVLTGFLANAVCIDETLTELCAKYIRILLLCSSIQMLANCISMFIDVSGHPQTVTIGMMLGVGMNILCDVIYVRVFHMDIGGAAWATVTGNVGSLVFFVLFVCKHRGMLKLVAKVTNCIKQFGEIVAKGIAGVVSVIAVIVLQMACNYFVQNACGADGMFVMSVGYSLLGVSNMVANGVGMAFTAIGGMLMGQKDYLGVRILFRRGMYLSMATSLVFVLVSCLLPRQVAGLFGAEEEELLKLCAKGIPFISAFVLALTSLVPLASHYQVIGKFTLATVSYITGISSVLVSFIITGTDHVWLTFPLACGLTIVIVLGAAVVTRHISRDKLLPISLIPATTGKIERYDISVECREEEIPKAIDGLRDYLDDIGAGKKTDAVCVCIEEMLLNIVQHSDISSGRSVDLLVLKEGNELSALLKDNGVAFDPTDVPEEKLGAGLHIARHYSDKINYSYTFGQNMTNMKWMLEAEK